MIEISIQEMMDAGAHFGHQTKRWNPKMKPFLYGIRSGIHIIDLQQTQSCAQKAFQAIEQIVANGSDVLFVGTKPQAQQVIIDTAEACQMPYVTKRWLGGMLTNFVTIRKSVERLDEFEAKREKNQFDGYTKKELLGIDREIDKLKATLGGIQKMKKIPGALFVIDPQVEKIAIHEANVLGIPVIAIVDSNCDPDPIDFPIPANDDAVRSIGVFASKIAKSCTDGLETRQALALKLAKEKKEEAPPKRTSREAQKVESTGKAFVSKPDSLESGEGESVESYSATVSEEKKPETKVEDASDQEAEKAS